MNHSNQNSGEGDGTGEGPVSRLLSRISNKIAKYYYLWKGGVAIVVTVGFVFYFLVGKTELDWIQMVLRGSLVAGMAAVATAIVTSVYLLAKRIPPTKERRAPGDYFCAMLNKAYSTRDISSVILFQFILRVVFIIFVVSIVITTYNRGFEEAHLEKWNTLCFLRMGFVLIYFLLSLVTVCVGLWKAHLTVASGNQELIKGVLWWPSIRDCFFILAISSTDFTIRDDLHLAYMIPMFSSWMLAKRGRARELLALVIACIIVRFIIVSVAAYYVGREAAAFPVSSEFPYLPTVTQYLIPPIIFWVALAVPFAALRFFHEREIDSRELLQKEKEILDIVTNHIDYPVFMKDKRRVFQYVNKPLAKRLNRKPTEIVGKTDENLGIDCEDYMRSDLAALHPPADDPDFVSQTIEPNFDRTDVKNPKILTIKVPVRSQEGEVIGLVGMCEPGTPKVVMDTSGRLFDQMPYYSSLKDVDGYIKWANVAFCEKDVGWDRAELLRLNDGRGARDHDLYNKEFADQFRADDLSVMEDAKAAIAMKRDSTGKDEIDPLAEGTLVKEETHFFKAQKKKVKVRVTKVPWLNDTETTILGVLVYYHEIE